eukprot:47543-Eustigmatos_ZCMA.PRE.1
MTEWMPPAWAAQCSAHARSVTRSASREPSDGRFLYRRAADDPRRCARLCHRAPGAQRRAVGP